MHFHEGPIHGVNFKSLRIHADARGWLCELFRHDELPAEWHPAMAYVSATQPGVCRGPHEHRAQTDYFAFLGPSDFRLHLWDNRPESATYRFYQTALLGECEPMAVVIPPGVVHAYENVGSVPGWVFNGPNRLYRGVGGQEPVDEIRHENDAHSPFVIPRRQVA